MPATATQPTREQLTAGVALIAAVAQTIRERETINAAHLYMALADRIQPYQFCQIIDTIKTAELIEVGPDHVIRWTGGDRA